MEASKAQAHALFVAPLLYNLAVREVLMPFSADLDNVWVVDPPDFPMFVQVLRRVTVLLTDSGGLQEKNSFSELADAHYARKDRTDGRCNPRRSQTRGKLQACHRHVTELHCLSPDFTSSSS